MIDGKLKRTDDILEKQGNQQTFILRDKTWTGDLFFRLSYQLLGRHFVIVDLQL